MTREYYAQYTSSNGYQTLLRQLPRNEQQQMEQITGYSAKGNGWILSMGRRIFSSPKDLNWLWDTPSILLTAYRERAFVRCKAARGLCLIFLHLVPNYESLAVHQNSPVSLRSVNKINFKLIRSVMFQKAGKKTKMLKLGYEEQRSDKRHFKPTQLR